MGGDHVGEQQRIVEAVDRKIRARGADADDARQDGACERPGGDRDSGGLRGLGRGVAVGLSRAH